MPVKVKYMAHSLILVICATFIITSSIMYQKEARDMRQDFYETKAELNSKIFDFTFNINLSENNTLPRDIIFNCANTTGLYDTIKCFNEEIKSIYSYNITNGSISFQDLKEKGGDCRNWAELYDLLAKKKGYSVKPIIIQSSNTTRHRISMIYNYEGFCIIDQLNFYCLKY